jgi:hypothetical protein
MVHIRLSSWSCRWGVRAACRPRGRMGSRRVSRAGRRALPAAGAPGRGDRRRRSPGRCRRKPALDIRRGTFDVDLIRLNCGHCGAGLVLTARLAGRRCACYACGGEVAVPWPTFHPGYPVPRWPAPAAEFPPAGVEAGLSVEPAAVAADAAGMPADDAGVPGWPVPAVPIPAATDDGPAFPPPATDGHGTTSRRSRARTEPWAGVATFAAAAVAVAGTLAWLYPGRSTSTPPAGATPCAWRPHRRPRPQPTPLRTPAAGRPSPVPQRRAGPRPTRRLRGRGIAPPGSSTPSPTRRLRSVRRPPGPRPAVPTNCGRSRPRRRRRATACPRRSLHPPLAPRRIARRGRPRSRGCSGCTPGPTRAT